MSKMPKMIAALGVVAGLGVVALPLSTYAIDPASKDSMVYTVIDETLTLELTGSKATGDNAADDPTTVPENTALVNLGKLLPDGAIVSGDLTALVKTNSKNGYMLTLIDKDTDNDMKSGTDAIPAGTPAVGKSAWGFKKGAITTADGAVAAEDDSAYTAVPKSGETAATIINSSKPTKVDADDPTNNGDTAVITFGASANSAQAAGTYSDVVVVTATANPSA